MEYMVIKTKQKMTLFSHALIFMSLNISKASNHSYKTKQRQAQQTNVFERSVTQQQGLTEFKTVYAFSNG